MTSKHPLADILLEHLHHYRGHWIKKLTPEMHAALIVLDAEDLKRAATLLIHGPSECHHGRERKFHRINEGWQFCYTNGKCPCFMEYFHEKSVETNMAKRGVKNAAQSEAIKRKMRETCLEKYGVETTGAHPARREKAMQTVQEKYGVSNVFASEEIKARISKQTMQKYDVAHISQYKPHQQKMLEAAQKKYNIANVAQLPATKEKMAKTNQERYGGPSPAHSPEVRQRMRETNLERFSGHPAQVHIATEHRIIDEEDFRKRFAGRRAIDIANETGYHPTMIHRYANQWDVELDYSGGDHRGAEKAFADTLIAEFGDGLRCQRILGDETLDRRSLQEIDVYFPTQRVGIEFCGSFWHSDRYRANDYHAIKLKIAQSQNIDLIQVFEDEWVNHPVAVLGTIRHRLGLATKRMFARSCSILAVDHHDAAAFYDQYHVYGKVSATDHLGLYADGVLVSCMSFTNRKEDEWELVRFASSLHIVGGASRLLTAFERRHTWTKIISFADLRWSKGDLYRTLGFTCDRYCPPDYSYVVGFDRIHKFNLRKTAKRFAKYIGQNLTERQMADLEGIPRVYDAGKLRFVKNCCH